MKIAFDEAQGGSAVVIRAATEADVRAIAELGEHFHAEAAWADIAEYSVSDCAEALTAMLESEILLVAERDGAIIGMAGGATFPLYFNHAHKSGQELFFWMAPGERSGAGARLMDAMEDAARQRGCVSWAMIALDKVRPDATGQYYRRRGYRCAEHSWIKRL